MRLELLVTDIFNLDTQQACSFYGATVPLVQLNTKRAQYSKIIGHARAQRDTAKDRWFVATRTKEGNVTYRREHLDFRSYRLSRVTLHRLL
jgi:hypothetical protein